MSNIIKYFKDTILYYYEDNFLDDATAEQINDPEEYPCLYADYGHHNTVKFGLQHPNFSFDFRNDDASEIVDSLKNLVTRAETLGFDSFWEMDTDNDTNQH